MAKVLRHPDGCWLWSASHDPTGYAVFTDENNRKVHAHRWAYRHFVGEIPEGLVVDHAVCSERGCVRPEHLVVTTRGANTLRSTTGRSALNAAKTHCVREHPLAGDNLYTTPGGRRMCRTCQKDREKAYRERVSAAR